MIISSSINTTKEHKNLFVKVKKLYIDNIVRIQTIPNGVSSGNKVQKLF